MCVLPVLIVCHQMIQSVQRQTVQLLSDSLGCARRPNSSIFTDSSPDNKKKSAEPLGYLVLLQILA